MVAAGTLCNKYLYSDQFHDRTSFNEPAIAEPILQHLKKARGFIVGTGSPFPLETDPDLIDILVATAHEHVLE